MRSLTPISEVIAEYKYYSARSELVTRKFYISNIQCVKVF